MIRGSCLCGATAYEISGIVGPMWFCHCARCRKESGAAFATWLAAGADGFRWTRGESFIAKFQSSAGHSRAFCARCGSPAPKAGADSIVVPAGSLDDDPGVRPSAHLQVASKANWHAITDDLPRFEGSSAEFKGLTDCAPTGDAVEGPARASCLCGAVTYEVAGKLETIHNCLCSRDRKATGSAHDSCLHVPVDAVRVLRGRELVRSYKVPESQYFTTQFCSRCGCPAPLPPGPSGDAEMCMAAGIFDVALDARVVGWIFEGSRAPWFEVTGSLPRFDDRPPNDFDWR